MKLDNAIAIWLHVDNFYQVNIYLVHNNTKKFDCEVILVPVEQTDMHVNAENGLILEPINAYHCTTPIRNYVTFVCISMLFH